MAPCSWFLLFFFSLSLFFFCVCVLFLFFSFLFFLLFSVNDFNQCHTTHRPVLCIVTIMSFVGQKA